MILKVIASLLTGIGGHYLNRRWDKAILFLCLFVFYWVAVYAFFIFSLQNISPSPEDMSQKYQNITQLLSKVSSGGILILWVASLITTIMDCKNKIEPNFTKWTKSGTTGAILTSILSFIILAFTVSTVYSLSNNQIINSRNLPESDSFSYSSYNFYENIYFGGVPSMPRNLPAPPTGKGIVSGEITYNNNPAAGVSLAIVLNSKYRAKDIITNSDGVFSVNLPPGAWSINSIQTESWENKPAEGSYTMYYGGEEKLRGKSYNRHSNIGKTGLPVNVTTDPNTILINATINKDIQLTWPNPKVEGLKATINDTISWENYPEASKYYVEIKKIRREGRTTYFEQITSRILSQETSIPLASLKYKETKHKEPTEYGVEIYAFSEDGSLIAEFSDTYQGGTFLIADGNVLVEEKLDDLFDLSSIENPDEFEKKMEAISLNKRRATAVSVLIDDNMLHEAKSLLNVIDSEYSQGEKEALTGYIFALQGKCNEANEMLERALSINPDICIPDRYKANCN